MIPPAKADRIMIYWEGEADNWITLRVAVFHYTIFKSDILDLLEIVELEIPYWLEKLIGAAQKREFRPIPEAAFPQSLPTLQTFRDMIPSNIEPGMSYPVWDGSQSGGMVLNPGGEPVMHEIPYEAKLRTGTFLGLNFWLQSGMLNGAACLVSQAKLFYRKSTETQVQYPLLDITGYTEGRMGFGATLWHVPGLADTDSHASEEAWAHNSIQYSGGLYLVDNWYYTDCPIPEVPNGHFMRPAPGARLKISTQFGTLGRGRLLIEDDFHQEDDINLVPFGCYPGWPDDSWLSQYGLWNDDSLGMFNFSTINAHPTPGYIWEHANTVTDDFGKVVWQEEEQEGIRFGSSVLLELLPIVQALKISKKRVYRKDDYEERRTYVDGERQTFAGNDVLY